MVRLARPEEANQELLPELETTQNSLERDMIGEDDECRALSSRRVWGTLELSSGRTFQEFPEESQGKRAGRAGRVRSSQ